MSIYTAVGASTPRCCAHQLRVPETHGVFARTACVAPPRGRVVSVRGDSIRKAGFKQKYFDEEETAVRGKGKGAKPGFKFDGARTRWVRDDNSGLSFDDPAFDPTVQPKSGSAYTLWPVCHTALKDYGLTSISPEEVMKMQKKGAVLLDVREEPQYNQIHAKGAINVPLFIPVQGNSMMDNLKRLAMAGFAMEATERNPTFVDEFVEQVPKKNQQVIVICATGGFLYTTVKTTSGKAGKYGGRVKEKSFKDPERAFGKESRSLKAAYELVTAGYTKVIHVDGGLNVWRSDDYPTEEL